MEWWCRLRMHRWEFHQVSVATENGSCGCLVIAFKICKDCAKTKLIHILPS
jgi:hypothetical protein